MAVSGAVSPQRPRRSLYLAALAGAVALTAGLSMPATAATAAGQDQTTFQIVGGAQTYLYASPQQAYPYYAIEQTQPDNNPPTEVALVNTSIDGAGPYQYWLQIAGTDTCLFADPQQVNNGGAIYPGVCSASNAYGYWSISSVNGGSSIQNVGANTCLDADGSTGGGDGQAIWQWTCNTADTFQVWARNS